MVDIRTGLLINARFHDGGEERTSNRQVFFFATAESTRLECKVN